MLLDKTKKLNRRTFIRQLFVYIICLSPIGKWLYDKWQKKRQLSWDGYIYAPYIPLQMSTLEFDKYPSKGFITRFNSKIV
jgi:hypothetical protein